jgi:hypothetical protein
VSRSDNWQGEPRDLDEWLANEEQNVLALLGREVLRLHGHLDTRAHHLMAVATAIQFVRDAPIGPRATLRSLASALREEVDRLTPAGYSPELSDARVFLGHVERILDWTVTG